MQYSGIVLHHSACPSINGKGFDFYVTKDGGILPGSEPTAPDRIHVCVEGDFNSGAEAVTEARREQLFTLQKLIVTLSGLYEFELSELEPHNADCPGMHFPWRELVISTQDGYH